MYFSIVLILIFLAGIYYYAYYHHPAIQEGLTNPYESRCPNILIQKGSELFLYNSKIAKIPGVNPIHFANLEDYIEFTDWQRNQGIRCPVLFLQHSYDAQSNSVYKVRPGPTDLKGGLPPYTNPSPMLSENPSVSCTPEGKPSTSLLQDSDKYVETPSSTTQTPSTNTKSSESEQNLLYSADPMDDNWGGGDYTQSLIDKGYYAGNEVSLYVS